LPIADAARIIRRRITLQGNQDMTSNQQSQGGKPSSSLDREDGLDQDKQDTAQQSQSGQQAQQADEGPFGTEQGGTAESTQQQGGQSQGGRQSEQGQSGQPQQPGQSQSGRDASPQQGSDNKNRSGGEQSR
jgi:hypothetical protein